MKPLFKNPFFSVLAMGAGAYVLYRILKPPSPQEKTQDKVVTEVKREEQSGVQPTFSDSVYMAMADALQAAMFDAGTDEGRIYSIFEKVKNKLDVLKIISAFSIRPYYTFGWKQGDYNLSQWFTEELSTAEISTLNTIISKKNISYQF